MHPSPFTIAPLALAQAPGSPYKLGLFGGRFDPVHLGHLLLAQQALEQLALDAVHFIPAASPVHKATVAPPQARAHMLELATANHPQFAVSMCELMRDEPSYTIDTVRAYRAHYPEAELYFLIGADAYRDFPEWEEAAHIMELVQMVVFARNPVPLQQLRALPAPFDQAHLLETARVDISSSALRRRLAQQQPIRYRLPLEVENYLAKYRLYQPEASQSDSSPSPTKRLDS